MKPLLACLVVGDISREMCCGLCTEINTEHLMKQWAEGCFIFTLIVSVLDCKCNSKWYLDCSLQ